MLRFAVITPTYLRLNFIKKMKHQMLSQTFSNWHWYVIHDGPSAACEQYFREINDSRFTFISLKKRKNDWGYSPRIQALMTLNSDQFDYCVFWDDDNFYPSDTLANIAAGLLQTNQPDFLISRIFFAGTFLPPPGKSFANLAPSDIDTACMTVRTEVAKAIYPKITYRGKERGEDVEFYQALISKPDLTGELSSYPPKIVYDGARRLQNLRWKLKIPPLGIANFPILNRIRYWLR